MYSSDLRSAQGTPGHLPKSPNLPPRNPMYYSKSAAQIQYPSSFSHPYGLTLCTDLLRLFPSFVRTVTLLVRTYCDSFPLSSVRTAFLHGPAASLFFFRPYGTPPCTDLLQLFSSFVRTNHLFARTYRGFFPLSSVRTAFLYGPTATHLRFSPYRRPLCTDLSHLTYDSVRTSA